MLQPLLRSWARRRLGGVGVGGVGLGGVCGMTLPPALVMARTIVEIVIESGVRMLAIVTPARERAL